MARSLKVYGWGGWWYDERNPGTHQQARFIMAAHSMAEIKRLLNKTQLWNICETGNKVEVPLALADPLGLYVCPLDDIGRSSYYKVSPTDEGVLP
jgi:hypothetical protein